LKTKFLLIVFVFVQITPENQDRGSIEAWKQGKNRIKCQNKKAGLIIPDAVGRR
jgi:hypothetical protein